MPHKHNTSTPLKDQNPSILLAEKTKTLSTETNFATNDKKKINSCITENKMECIETEMDISNDLEQECNHSKCIVPKYISPLDNIER